MKFFKNGMLFFLLLLFNVSIFAASNKTSEFNLSNGLKLVVIEDHRAPIVVSQIWYKVGSGYERCGMTGISHFLEHMMFEGTEKYKAGVLKEQIVNNGGEINATTSNDLTMYYEIMPKDKLPLIFSLEADRMVGLLIDETAFTHEKQAILEERKQRTQDDQQGRTFERFSAAAYVSSPYRNPTIGWISDLENLSRKDLYAWYKTWYAPNNAVLVVAGDVIPKNVFELARKYFGNLPEKEMPELRAQADQEQLGKRTVEINVPAKLPWLIMGYNVPSLKTADQKWEAYALEIAASVLDIGNSSRIAKELIRKKQIAIEASAEYPIYSRLDVLFLLEGTPAKNTTVAKLEKAFTKQIEKLQTDLIPNEELERVKTQIIADKVYSLDSIEGQGLEKGALEVVGISWREADKYVDNIKKITPEQVRKVAQKYLTNERLTVAILKPKEIVGAK